MKIFLDKQKKIMIGLHRLNWCGLTGAYNPGTKEKMLPAYLFLVALTLKMLAERDTGMSDENSSFTQIPNQLLEKLESFNLPGEESRLLAVIIRQTFGYHQTSAKISLECFFNRTGIKKKHVIPALNSLRLKNIITIPQIGNDKDKTYSIQTNYLLWKSFPKRGTFPKQGTTVPQIGNLPVPQIGNAAIICTKENIIKETLKEIPLISPKWENESKSLKIKSKNKQKDYTPEFLEFWDLYPRKEDKGRAFKSWIKALNRKHTAEKIITGLKANLVWLQVQATKDLQNNYCKKACYWLDDDCFEEDHSPSTPPNGQPAEDSASPTTPPVVQKEFMPHPDGSGRFIDKSGQIYTAEKKKFLKGGVPVMCTDEELKKTWRLI